MKPFYEDNYIQIYHGDCLNVLPTIATSDMFLLTDPPYGKNLENHGRSESDYQISGDKDQSLGIMVLEMFSENPQIVFASPMLPWPGKWRQHLVWNKGGAVGGGGDIQRCWKFDWELVQVKNTPALSGQRDSSVLYFPMIPQDYGYHPTPKSIPLLSYLIKKAVPAGSIIRLTSRLSRPE